MNAHQSTHQRVAGRRSGRLAVTAACVIALGAIAEGCGSSTARGADVASLGTDASKAGTDGTGGSPTSSSVDPKDAFVEYTKCMRTEGVDMADPQVVQGSKGGDTGPVTASNSGSGAAIAISGPGGVVASPVDVDSDTFKAASEKCQPILDAAQSQIKIDPKVEAEQRQKMLTFSKCMRDHGIDMPDPVFGDNGSISISAGSNDEASSGADPQSDAYQQASKACGDDNGGFVVGAPVTTP